MRWTLEGEATLDGAVTSMSMVSNGTEILVGTDSGRMYRMLVDDLSSQVRGCLLESEPSNLSYGLHTAPNEL